MRILCKLFFHNWGKWVTRGHGGYQKRWCKRCDDWELRPTPGVLKE